MRVWICGARGSAPAVGSEYLRVGGNTSCVAIARDGAAPSLVLDAGTGIRNVTRILDGAPFRGTLVLGHLHWDHTYGIPFFRSGDHPDAKVRLLLPEQGVPAFELLSRAMGPPHFPITPAALRGDWTFACYDEGKVDVEDFDVEAYEIPHKGGRTMGIRVSDGTSTIAYLSDHAPQDLGAGPHGTGAFHPAAVTLARDAALLIHDAQYTAVELPVRGAFGHAAADYPVDLARHAGAKRVLLFHHDPARTDDEVEAIHASCAGNAPGVEVMVATEGLVLDL